MASLDITRGYAQGEALLEADLDAIRADVETLLNSTGLNSDNMQTNSITASSKVASASISTIKLAGSSVTTAKIADSNVTTAKIADSNVTTAKIADSNVTTAKIADSNVTTAKIADGAVTKAKLAASGHQLSTEVSSYSLATTGSNSATTITNLSVSITTTGRPVFITLADQATTSDHLRIYETGAGAGNWIEAIIEIYFDSTATGIKASLKLYTGDSYTSTHEIIIPGACITGLYQPAAGTYTVTAKISNTETSTAFTATNLKLFALEL